MSEPHLDLVFRFLTFLGGIGGTIATVFTVMARFKRRAEEMEHELLRHRMRAIETELGIIRGQLSTFIQASHQAAIEVAKTAQAQAQMKETVDDLKETAHELRGAVQNLVVAVAEMRR